MSMYEKESAISKRPYLLPIFAAFLSPLFDINTINPLTLVINKPESGVIDYVRVSFDGFHLFKLMCLNSSDN